MHLSYWHGRTFVFDISVGFLLQNAAPEGECTCCVSVLAQVHSSPPCAVRSCFAIMGDGDGTLFDMDVDHADGHVSLQDALYGQLQAAPYGGIFFADPDFGGKWVLCDIVTQERVVLEPEEGELDVVCDDDGSEACISVFVYQRWVGACLHVCSSVFFFVSVV